jgi:hypothetical protein
MRCVPSAYRAAARAARACAACLRRGRAARAAPAGSARSEARNSHGGRALRAAAHGGPHTKTEGLGSDIAADAREYDAARAGLSMSEEEAEQEELPEGVAVQPVAPPLTPQGVTVVVTMPPELQ